MTRKNFEIPALYLKNFEISSMDFLVGNFNKNNVLIYNLGIRYSHIADKKYWKISWVVEVITSENIEFITSGQYF